MRGCTAALVQLRATDDLPASMRRAVEWTTRALGTGADLVVLPENYAGIGGADQRRAWAFDPQSPASSPALGPLCELSRATSQAGPSGRRGGAYIVAGGVPERADDHRTYNTCVVIHDGSVIATYRKLHLFDADLPDGTQLRESDYTVAGKTPVVVDTAFGRLGLSICYDLRFPELYRALSAAGADILLVPSAFTLLTGMAHWEPLLRARAIENQCWVLAAAQWGVHGPRRHSYGHSMVVDPWGTVVAQASQGDGLVVAHLDPATMAWARARLPTSSHRVSMDDVGSAGSAADEDEW